MTDDDMKLVESFNNGWRACLPKITVSQNKLSGYVLKAELSKDSNTFSRELISWILTLAKLQLFSKGILTHIA